MTMRQALEDASLKLKQISVDLYDWSDCLYCDESLPEALVFREKYYSSGRVRLRGWFLSPYMDAYIHLFSELGDSIYRASFVPRKSEFIDYPQYRQFGRGFYMEMPLVEGDPDLTLEILSGETCLAYTKIGVKDEKVFTTPLEVLRLKPKV